MKPKLKKQLSTIIKIAVSVGLIWLVFKKLDWEQLRQLLKTAGYGYLAAAVFFFLLSQLISVLRFDVFIRKIGIRMSFSKNIQLYMLGMFYNFFIPGGVGGDAYKVVLLNKSHRKSVKKIGQIVFIERFTGIVAIGLLFSVFIFFIPTPFNIYWNYTVGITGIIATILILRLIIKFLRANKKRIHIVFIYSLLVQICQLICMIFILKSFGVEDNYKIYLVLFLISSVLSVISFAGVGIREAVFYFGAEWYNFNADVSAGAAIIFSVLTALTSFFGIIYLFYNIDLKNKSQVKTK